jgi:acetoin utilization protein AcuB
MLVKDYMTRDPITALPETTHKQAAELMREHNITHLPVVDKNGKLIGIVVEEDLLQAQPSPATTLSIYEIHSLLSKLQLKQIMTRTVYTVVGDCSLEEAARIMLQEDIGCLPVMDKDKLVGIITDTDIFQVFVAILGGGQEGARFSLRAPDKPGILAKVAQAVASAGGNIISVVTWRSKNDGYAYITIKERGADFTQLQAALDQLEDNVVDLQERPLLPQQQEMD